MKLLFAAPCVLATLLAATPAFAQEDDTGFYMSLNGGLASVNDLDVTFYAPTGTFGGTGARDTIDFSYDLDNAFAFGGAIGYDFGMIRTDVEVSYHRNKATSVRVNGVNGSAVTLDADDRAVICDYLETDSCGGSGNSFTFNGSRARQLSALANLWVDFPVGGVTPYVGGGLGVTGYELDGEGEARFAWQLGAGVAVPLVSNISLTGDYRYRQSKGVTIEDSANEGLILDDVKTNTFSVGLRVRF